MVEMFIQNEENSSQKNHNDNIDFLKTIQKNVAEQIAALQDENVVTNEASTLID